MTHHIDEFSKSLANESIPRRDTFRLLGAALAGAFLSPLGLRTAWAGAHDPCKALCHCRNNQEQDACLAACHTCNGNKSRLCGSCGSHVCCPWPGPYQNGACVDGHCSYWCVDGYADCGNGCIPLSFDPNNCGACGNVCPQPATTCYQGVCIQNPCGGGEVYCPHTPVNPGCTDLRYDGYNCGACGIVCGGPCYDGVCGGGDPHPG